MTRILLIEDEAAVAAGLRYGLQAEGYEVLWEQTCAAGIETLKKRSPELLILDVRLPDGSGFDLCRKIRDEKYRLPILMLTARDAEVDKILKEAGEASQEAGEKRDEKMAELRKELAEAREDGGDREAMREIFGKMRALRGTGQARTDLVKKIEGALGDDGVAAFKKALAAPGRSSRISTLLQGISQLNLSLRQQRQVDKVLNAAIDKIKKTLTPAQRAKLKAAAARNAERRAGGRRGGGRARTE